jgi:glycosyltransferase involved in cell wall biosynthesis
MTTADRLRIAYLGDPGSVHLRRWAGWFAARGHDVHVLVPVGVETPPPPDGIAVHPFRGLPSSGISLASVRRSRADLRRALAEIKPDLLHAHYARRPAWHAWLSGHRPYVVTVWGSDVLLTERMTLLGGIATRLALRTASVVTAASDATASAAVALGARRDRMRRIGFGVDLARFAPGPPDASLRATLGLGWGRIILSPRAMTPLYRHETVLEAFSELPDDTVLVASAMNADPAYRARLEEQAASLGVGDRLRILPAVEYGQMPALYRAADVVVSVPESDGEALSVLEAMASGVPVVVSDLPGVRERLSPEAPQLVVPVGDASSTLRALRAVLEMGTEERASLVASLRRKVEDEGSHERNMEEMERIYRDLRARWRAA